MYPNGTDDETYPKDADIGTYPIDADGMSPSDAGWCRRIS